MAPWPIPWLYDALISPWRRRKEDDDADETLAGLRDSTRRFVLALRVPSDDRKSSVGGAGGLVYVLAAEALSEQSASDAAELVRATRPAAVVAQVAPGALAGLRSEEEDGSDSRVPTSFFGVIRDCFLGTTQRASYESKAGIEVLRSIFGTTFNGHVVRAKSAAREANSAFLYLETPQVSDSSANVRGFGDQGLGTRSSGFAKFTAISSEVASRVHASSFHRLSSFQPGLDVARYLSHQQQEPAESECPTFAVPFYYLLVELQDTYRQLPGMNQALQHARKLLFDVEQGRPVDQEELAQAQNFRLAVEGLRIALNSAAHEPQLGNSKHGKAKSKVAVKKFDDLSHEDKGHVILAQAIQDQARRHGTVVAVMDANSVAGIRKHWNTVVPPEVAALAQGCFVYGESNGVENFGEGAMEKTLVGSGAVAAVGIAALPWWAPATPFTKVLILKAPAFAKLGFIQMKRNAAIIVSKTVAPILTPGKAFSAIVKTATSAGKARAAAHSVVATAERATFSAMRTAFYCLMRKKQGMSSGGRPWLLLGGSVAAGAGILWCGDKLESAIESAPTAPTVARLGRGLENLQHTAQSLSEARPRQIWEDLYRTLHK